MQNLSFTKSNDRKHKMTLQVVLPLLPPGLPAPSTPLRRHKSTKGPHPLKRLLSKEKEVKFETPVWHSDSDAEEDSRQSLLRRWSNSSKCFCIQIIPSRRLTGSLHKKQFAVLGNHFCICIDLFGDIVVVYKEKKFTYVKSYNNYFYWNLQATPKKIHMPIIIHDLRQAYTIDLGGGVKFSMLQVPTVS